MKRQRPSYCTPLFCHFPGKSPLPSPPIQSSHNTRDFKYLKNLSISRKLTTVTEVPQKNLLFFSGSWIEVWNRKTLKCIKKFPYIQSNSLQLFQNDILIGISGQKQNLCFFCIRLDGGIKCEFIYMVTGGGGSNIVSVRCFDYIRTAEEEKLYYVAHESKIHVYDMITKKNKLFCNVQTGRLLSMKIDSSRIIAIVMGANDQLLINVFSREDGMCHLSLPFNQNSPIDNFSFEKNQFLNDEALKLSLKWKLKKELTHRWAIPVTDSILDIWLESSLKKESLEKLFSTTPLSTANMSLEAAMTLLKRAEWFVIPVNGNQLLLKLYLPEQGFLRKVGILKI